MSSFLLDVNVLVAILSRRDPRHAMASQWFREHGHVDWATCAIVENGTLRTLTNPATSLNPITFALAAEMLESLFPLGKHRFLADSISMLDTALIDRSVNVTPRQTTDVYLLALAVHHGVTFATFDRNVVARAVVNGPEHLLVLR